MSHLTIDTRKCIGCGKCAKMCLMDNISIVDRKAVETGRKCIGCGHCVSSCPKNAIRLNHKAPEDRNPVDEIRASQLLDGSLVSEKELDILFQAMDHNKGRCQFVVLQWPKLNKFMYAAYAVLKEKGSSNPVFTLWKEFMENPDSGKPNPVLWDGQQVLFIFANTPERSMIASERMVATGFPMGIRGFPSTVIMSACQKDWGSLSGFFPGVDRPLQEVYVIGHGRRVVEPLFKPISKAKGLVGKIFKRFNYVVTFIIQIYIYVSMRDFDYSFLKKVGKADEMATRVSEIRGMMARFENLAD